MFSDTAKTSAFSDAAAFSDAQKRCGPWHSHSPDKFEISDTPKKSAFVTLQHLVTPRKLVHPSLRLKCPRSGTWQRSVTLIKDMRLLVYAASTNTCVVTWQRLLALRSTVHSYGYKNSKRFVALQRFTALVKEMHPPVHTALASPCLVTWQR